MRRELIVPVSLLLVVVAATPLFAQLPAGWTGKDQGSPAAAGSVQYDQATETWTIRGDGTGIRGTADQFYYVYKAMSGDGELVARIVSLDPALADWSMAGVMIRVMLTPGSPYAFMGVSANTDTKDHGITFWGREGFNVAADHESSGAVTAPYWVKVKRSGDTFAGYSSPDGKEWTEQYSTAAPGIPKSTYIGYAVTSEVGGKLITAVIDRGPAKASSPAPADGARNIMMPLLRWTPGVVGMFHDVYFGTNPTPTAAEYQGRLTLDQTMYFHAPGLIPGTTYYWRIDEVGADSTTVWAGDVWSFTSASATAYAPQPWNGVHGVGSDADLAWTAGVDALSHDVYFGTDKAAVAAGDAGTFKGNQQKTTYEPGTLAENTAYYWRVDEHDADGVVHPGELWSFRTIGPEVGVQAQYFSGKDATGIPLLTRVESSIDHDWGNGEVAAGLSDGISARWTADLEAPFTETFQLITASDDGVKLWLDGRLLINNWTDHGTAEDVASVNLVAGQIYLLEMAWYENSGGAVARLLWQSPSVSRQAIPAGPLQLPRRATAPYPANTALNAPQTLLLRWNAGQEASHHDVYFGDSAAAVAGADAATTGIYQGRQTVAADTFNAGVLEWNKTYYWRIDEVNNASADSPWAGSVWSFTTADFLVIDDFESYTDAEGSSIYETWIDGWANNTSGSRVGYLDPPFAEQIIVHGGTQSMPLDYNNVNAPYYSEAERTFARMQDLTVNGVNTLVLFIRGKATNDAAPLYLGLEDSAGKLGIVKHADAGVTQATAWTEWKIPLSEFTAAGVNAAKVKKMYIGLGDKAHPVPGGYGLLFVDDIRVIKP